MLSNIVPLNEKSYIGYFLSKLEPPLEIDLVEDIRSFVKQKCSLDKSYAESLLKLSTNFQNRKLPEGSFLLDNSKKELLPLNSR